MLSSTNGILIIPKVFLRNGDKRFRVRVYREQNPRSLLMNGFGNNRKIFREDSEYAGAFKRAS